MFEEGFVLLTIFVSLMLKIRLRRKRHLMLMKKRRRNKLLLQILKSKSLRSSRRRGQRSDKFVNNQMFWEKDVPKFTEMKFKKTFRMSRNTFQKIVDKTRMDMTKCFTTFGAPIPPEKRVAIALYYLKSGADFDVVGTNFNVGKTTVCNILTDFCNSMLKRYLHQEIQFPDNLEQRKLMADRFEKRWQFPGVLGAIDGSHIPIKKPTYEGAEYHNYKGWSSTVLLACCDYKYR